MNNNNNNKKKNRKRNKTYVVKHKITHSITYVSAPTIAEVYQLFTCNNRIPFNAIIILREIYEI